MRKSKWRLKPCGRITAIVILLSFLKYPMCAEPLTGPPPNLTNGGTKFYSDLEVNRLIDELTEAAHEAIELAAGEAARAAMLSSLERETAALREAQRWRIQAETNALAIKEAKKKGINFAIIVGAVCLLGGFAVGTAINK